MQKIGIITLVGSDNCGSLLQTYALQTYLEQNFDCKVEVINYKDRVSAQTYGILAPAIIMRPVQLFRTLQHYGRLKRQQLDYARFRDREIHLTGKEYHSLQELQTEKWDYDILISGSDQVWNWPEAYVDETYFLDWGGDKARRIAYAPSTGGSINPDDSLLKWVNGDAATLGKIRRCLANFQMISVREESGQIYLSRLLGRDILLTADPTLMLDIKRWHNLAGEAIVEGDYIFYYSYGYKNDSLNALVQQAADRLKLPVYVINASLWNHKSNKKLGFKIHDSGGPYAYLSLMKYAKYVFAESFHGCIFAFVFQRNFWFLNNFSDGRIEARIKSLLGYLQLEDRILHEKNIDHTALQNPIDYSRTFAKLDALCMQSRRYLEAAIAAGESVDFTKDSLEYQISQQVQWDKMTPEQIKKRFENIKPRACRLMKEITDTAFEQYFHVGKEDMEELSPEDFLERVTTDQTFLQQLEYNRLAGRLGYLGHLIFRTKQKFGEGGIKSVWKAFLTKYKWWFHIGY